MVQTQEGSLQIILSGLKALLHPAAHTVTHALVDIECFIKGVDLLLHDLCLHPCGLRNQLELVMGHNDTVVVIILHPVQEILPVAEILLGRIKDAVIRKGGLIGLGNSRYIRLHTDDDRLMHQAKTTHLMCCDTHDERLTGSDLMITDTAAVLKDHPDGILLGLIDILDLVLAGGKSLQVKTGEGLMAAVELRTDEAVVFLVIHLGKAILPLTVMLHDPLLETVADLVDLAGCKLYLLMVRNHDRVAAGTVAAHTLDDGNSVIEGMAQQVQTVKFLAALRRYDELRTDLLTVGTCLLNDELIEHRRIVHADIRTEELRGEIGEIPGRHPALSEVKIQLLKLNRGRDDSLQGFNGLFDVLTVLLIDNLIIVIHFLDVLQFPDDIAGEEPRSGLPGIALGRIQIDHAAKLLTELQGRKVGQFGHIVHIDLSISVQGGIQRILGIVNMRHLICIEADGTVENVGLLELAVTTVLNGHGVTSKDIKQEHTGIDTLSHRTEHHHETVVMIVQLLTEVILGRSKLGLSLIKFLVGVTD